MRSLVMLAFAATLSTAWAGQTIYGLKSAASGGTSSPPTHLFSFDGTNGGVTDHGAVTYEGQSVDADALASDGKRLYAFLLEQGRSRLVQIDPATAVASSLAVYEGAQMRGATYRDGRLYTLDVTEGSTYRSTIIDLATLMASSVDLDTTIANGCDLDFDASGTLWVAESNAFHILDPISGALTFVVADLVVQPSGGFVYNPGFAFDETAPGRALTYEANGTDDLYAYVMPSPARSPLTLNILPSYNSGRGDLAAVPEPASLFGLTLALGWLGRRRNR